MGGGEDMLEPVPTFPDSPFDPAGGSGRVVQARVLGPVRLGRDGQWLPIGGAKQRTVLAALLLARGAGVPNSRLERLLWGDHPPESAHAQIQTYVSKLRRLLGRGGAVVRQGSGYALILGPCELDLAQFERRAERGRQALFADQHQEAAEHLRAALALWQGTALADVTEHMRRVEQPRLEELRLAAVEDRVDADLALVHEHELVPELTGLVAEHPLRERLRGQLMLALHRAGRRAEALGVYRAGRRLLLDEMGLEPGERLRRIHEAILGNRPGLPVTLPGLPATQPATQPAAVPEPGVAEATPASAGRTEATEVAEAARPAQLPPAGVELVGRDKEIGAVLGRLPAGTGAARSWVAPVCVITGMAGAGKTVLAVHVAQRLREAYPDGQLYADLRGLDAQPADSAEILARFLQALGVPAGCVPDAIEERLALYRSRVADRRILVVLDDASSAVQVRPLLPSGAGCAAIVTCRTRLSCVEGADTVELDLFGVDEAVALLGRLAGEERIAAEPQASRSIAQSCGCLPLAVGIAGARLAARQHWPPSRLARRLSDERRRLDELSHDGMDVRTALLRGAHSLPPGAAQAWRLLARLDVPGFAPWTVAALLDVPAEMAEELVDALVDARLLEVVADPGRYPYHRFHVLVRAVAREQAAQQESPVSERAALGRAFGAWLALAREAERWLTGQGVAAVGGGRSRRLPDDIVVDELRTDPAGWVEAERHILHAVVAQARTENRRVLSSELSQVLARLERAVGRPTAVRRPVA